MIAYLGRLSRYSYGNLAGDCSPLYNRLYGSTSVTRPRDGEKTRSGRTGARWHHYSGFRERETPAGSVIAVGSGKLLESGERAPVEVKAGDRILFGKYSGSEIKLEGDEYLILKEDEILAMME